jgi:8-amino-7-oxononanoate synthase
VNLDTWLATALLERREKNLLRELKTSKGLIDFVSNDYLGLARSKVLFSKIHEQCIESGLLSNGATGSRLLSGNMEYTEQVEFKLKTIFKSDAALILNSGYTANLAVFSSIPQKGDTILLDEFAHASIKDGARLSLAKRFSFRHNSLDDLESKLKRATGKIFVAVESIYSMDGDASPLRELTTLAKKYGAFLIVDEAHSTGVVGQNGSGLSTYLGLENDIDIRIYTFGKAMGIHGACIVGSEKLIQYIINFARPFIYTTALTPHSVVGISTAFDYVSDNIDLQNVLKNNIGFYLTEVNTLTNRTPSTSAIQTVILPGNENVKNAALNLQQAGFDVRPIVSPTVQAGAERLRIILHSYNTFDDISSLAQALRKISGENYQQV